MTTSHRLCGTLLAFTFLSLCEAQSSLQKPGSEGYAVVSKLDADLFQAYNTCDLKVFRALLEDDLEFYHDQTGLMKGADSTVDAVRKNICGKVTRELVPGTLQIYPLYGYGAVEMGTHRFHHPGHDDTEAVGEGKFFNVWHVQNGTWKLARTISWDHYALPMAPKVP